MKRGLPIVVPPMKVLYAAERLISQLPPPCYYRHTDKSLTLISKVELIKYLANELSGYLDSHKDTFCIACLSRNLEIHHLSMFRK